MFRPELIVGIAALAVLPALAMPTSAAAGCVESGCVLVWSDDFDGTAVDTTKWGFQTGDGSSYGIPGWGNNERQYYRSNNATVANGELTITARAESFGGYGYTSARLRTAGLGDWRYGRFEMRASLPAGQGMWPAFWMLPSSDQYGGWAASGEIDIMESVGSEPERILGSLHYGGEFPGNTYTSSDYVLPDGDASVFHVYALEWDETEIRWYVDDVLYATRTQWWSANGPYPAPFDQEFHLLLNLAVGGNLPGDPDATTVFPQEYKIDYVHVYQFPADIAPPQKIFDDMEHGDPFANNWFSFGSNIGGGGLDANYTDLPPQDGGNVSLQTGWGSGGVPGYFGGFGREQLTSLDNMTGFSFWINPDPGQDYRLEINLQDDDNGDGLITTSDDEYQYDCVVSPVGPCAIAGGGWQRVSVPLADFQDDNSIYLGNGQLDATPVAAGGNGELVSVVIAVISNSGADATFRTDFWAFNGQLADTDDDGAPDLADNCLEISNPDQTDSNGDGIGNACDMDLTGPAGIDDCMINFLDLSVMQTVFFSSAGSANWNPDADFTGPAGAPDGIINFSDLGRMQQFFFSAPGPSGLPNDCSP